MARRFTSPLCIGYHTKVDEASHTVQQQDGFVSSMLLLIMLTSVGVTLSLAHWLTEGILESTVEILLLVFMLAAGILCTYIIHKGEPNEVFAPVLVEVPDTISQQAQSLQQGLSQWFKNIIKGILPLIGIVLFYVLGLFLDFFRIICHLTCMSTFSYCGLLSTFSISVVYHFGRIFFMGLLMLFCIKLHNKVLSQTCSNRYILVVILATTMCMWIDSTLWDSKEIFGEEANKANYTCKPARNGTGYKYNSNCLNQTTTLYKNVETMSYYFYPLNIEFLLLVIESLFHLFFGMKELEHVGMLNKLQQGSVKSRQGHTLRHEGQQLMKQGDGMVERGKLLIRQAEHKPEGQAQQLVRCGNQTVDLGETLKQRGKEVLDQGDEMVRQQADHNDPAEHVGMDADTGNQRNSTATDLTQQQHTMGSSGSTTEMDAEAGTSSARMSVNRPPTSPDGAKPQPDPATAEGPSEQTEPKVAANGAPPPYGQLEKQPGQGSERTLLTSSGATTATRRSYGSTPSNLGADTDPLLGTHHEPQQPSSGMNRLFYAAIIINITFAVLAALTYITDDETHWILVYQYAKPVYWATLLAVISVALHVTRDFKSHFHSYSGLELFVMMATLGFYIYSFFTIISALAVAVLRSTSSPHVEGADQVYLGETLKLFFNHDTIAFPSYFPCIVLLDQVLNSAQIYLQTAFMLHAGRVHDRTDPNRLRVFKECLIFLVISNFTIWAVDSFVEMKSIQLEPVQMTFFDHYSTHTWEVLAHVTMPIVLFYRFNSFIIMLEVFLEH